MGKPTVPSKDVFLPLECPAVANHTRLGLSEGEGGIVWRLRNERSVGNWDVEQLRELHSWTMAAGSLQLMRETSSPKPPLTLHYL